jgi:hypothetical protein
MILIYAVIDFNIVKWILMIWKNNNNIKKKLFCAALVIHLYGCWHYQVQCEFKNHIK